MVKGEKPEAFNSITITHPGNTKEDITTKFEMDKALINYNATHFNQSSENSFAQSPLKDIIPPLELSLSITQKSYLVIFQILLISQK